MAPTVAAPHRLRKAARRIIHRPVRDHMARGAPGTRQGRESAAPARGERDFGHGGSRTDGFGDPAHRRSGAAGCHRRGGSAMSGAEKGPRRVRGARPLADFIAPGIADMCGRAGFSVVEVVTHWDEIVGPALAPKSVPLKLQWPRGPEAEPATLVVRVEGAYAIELQHAAPVVLERINTYFGWRCVGRIALRQGPVPPRRARPAVVREPEAGEVAAVRREMGAFADEDLAASLARLGALVRRERRGPGR